MSAEKQDYAGNFAVGGCFIIVSFSLALAAALYIVEGILYPATVFLIAAGLVGLFGCYNAFRALEEVVKKSEAN